MANNAINLLKNLSVDVSELKKQVTVLPELRGSRAIVNPFGPQLSSREKEKRKVIRAGNKALDKIERGLEGGLSEEEERGLEAIILEVVRPAILIKKGHFSSPPVQWLILNKYKNQIEQSFACVGRIEVSGHPRHQWVGTGFVAGDGVVMTNRHVAEEFAELENETWKFISGRSAGINFIRELGVQDTLEFEVEGIIGIHEHFDLALLSVKAKSAAGADLIVPLKVMITEPPAESQQQVYVVGYPAFDGRRNAPNVMSRIFEDIYDVKRLQPGKITGFDPNENKLLHDCSTLGGNSGSPVFDMTTSQVVGLHFGGRYLQNNNAVALWTMTDDPLLRDVLNFV